MSLRPARIVAVLAGLTFPAIGTAQSLDSLYTPDDRLLAAGLALLAGVRRRAAPPAAG